MVVLISPTRVRNFVKRSTVYLSRRVLISPTRVRNVYRPCRWPTMRFSSPHQPYEGSQHGHLRLEYPPDVVLISPTRVRNAISLAVGGDVGYESSSALRGFAT